MAPKADSTPTVKAYGYGNSIIVKYYDTGELGSLSCPLCHWGGSLEFGHAEPGEGFAELRCPDCNTKLARVSPGQASLKC